DDTPAFGLRYFGSKSSPVKCFALSYGLFMLRRKRISRGCAGSRGQNNVGSSVSRLFATARMMILSLMEHYRLQQERVKILTGPRFAGLQPRLGFRRCRDISSTPVSAMS